MRRSIAVLLAVLVMAIPATALGSKPPTSTCPHAASGNDGGGP